MRFLVLLPLLATMAQAQESWDLAKCRQALAEGKAEPGHTCTPEHLDSDLALLREAPQVWNLTPQLARDVVTAGGAIALAEGAESLRKTQEAQKEEEKRVSALDPKLKGAELLEECELYLRLIAIMSGTEAAALGTSQELANFNYSAGSCEGYILGVADSLNANWACPSFLVKPFKLGHRASAQAPL